MPEESFLSSAVCNTILRPLVHYQHLQTVLNVRAAHIRVVIQRKQFDIREHLLKFFTYAAAYNVVRQAAEGLKDNKILAAVFCIVDYLCRDQYAFTGIKGMMDNIIRIHCQLIHKHCLLVQGLILCDPVGYPVRKVKELICHVAPEAGRLIAVYLKLRDLLALAELGLLDNVGHLCFDDLKAVIFQIALYLIICAGMEVQQIFTHYEYRRLGM